MPYVKRDDNGRVVAVSLVADTDFVEELAEDSAELSAFLSPASGAGSLDDTDQGFVRVLEDVVELLIDKGVILFTELPQSAQGKILARQQLRSELAGRLDLIGED